MTNLRTQAATDLQSILEDDTDGFGWDITVTNPAGTAAALVGFATDVFQLIDPELEAGVAGRVASVALRIASLTAAGLAIPREIPEEASKPWLVTFNDINGTAYTWKVSKALPDMALGIVTCLLEAYDAG